VTTLEKARSETLFDSKKYYGQNGGRSMVEMLESVPFVAVPIFGNIINLIKGVTAKSVMPEDARTKNTPVYE
jgi:hypothetical protein